MGSGWKHSFAHMRSSLCGEGHGGKGLGVGVGTVRVEPLKHGAPEQKVLLFASEGGFIFSDDPRRVPKRHVCIIGCSELKIRDRPWKQYHVEDFMTCLLSRLVHFLPASMC